MISDFSNIWVSTACSLVPNQVLLALNLTVFSLGAVVPNSHTTLDGSQAPVQDKPFAEVAGHDEFSF